MRPPLPPELMQAVLLVTALVAVAMLVALVMQRALRRSRLRRRAALDARFRRLVLESSVAEDDELEGLLARVRSLDEREHDHIARMVFPMLRDVSGEAGDRLRAIARAAGAASGLVDAAHHRNPLVRADAAEALGVLAAPEALELLLELAVDRDRHVRTVAIRALGAFDEPRAVGRVLDALAASSGVSPSVAATALLQQGAAASDRVLDALLDRDPGVRRGAARVAGLLQVPGAGKTLALLVTDSQESVRLAAMQSLEQLPVREAVPALLAAALKGGTEGEAAARALISMPATWSSGALALIRTEAEAGVRRAAGLPRLGATA